MNAAWKSIEHWLSGDSAESAASGLQTTVEATWGIAPGLVTLVLLVSAFVILFVYLRETATAGRAWKVLLATIRTALVGIVLMMLLGWVVQRHRTDLPDVIVMLDDSASMGIVDTYDDAMFATAIQRRLAAAKLDEPSRLNLAKTLLIDPSTSLLESLSRHYNVKPYLAAGSARPALQMTEAIDANLATVAANQPASRLGNCVREVLDAQRGRATAAIVLLTDGVTTDGKSLADAAQVARRKDVPLYLVGLGSEKLPRDLALDNLLADEAGFVGDTLHFDAQLISSGFSGEAVVRLHKKDDAVTIAEQTVAVDPSGAPQPIRLTWRADQPGECELVLEVTPREGEANVENNRLARRITIRDVTIRVLLVQGYPSYEFRFLKQMLLRELNPAQPADAQSAVRTVLQEADLEYGDTDKTAERTFPASREELFQYDVLIFGDVNPSLMSPSMMEHIYEFVTVRGGGVVFSAGPRYTPLAYRDSPLAPLLPMNIDTVRLPDQSTLADEFRPRLTPLGQASPTMQLADSLAANERLWREELPALRWLLRVPDLRPGVRVLAEHPTLRRDNGTPLPVICLQFIGAGKVVFHATDETYRWRFRVGDTYFARYWIQTIRYLCRSKLLAGNRSTELSTDREEYRRGNEVIIRVRFIDDRLAPAADDGVTVVIERDGGERTKVGLHRHATERGVFEGSAGELGDGAYRTWLATPALEGETPSHKFTVASPPGELAHPQMNAKDLREAAKISGGKFYTLTTAGNMLNDLPRGRRMRVESLPPQALWNSPFIAAAFVALITAEWLLRKRLGML